MKKNRKKYIWFDLGYTLLYLKRETNFQGVLEDLGLKASLDDIGRAFHLTDKLFMRKYPGILGKNRGFYMPIYLGNMLHTLDLRTDICPLYDTWKRKLEDPLKVWIPFDFVREELQRLREEGYRLGVISNWDRTALPILNQYELTPLFDNIIISSQVGVEKPEAGIFKIALDAAGVSADDCLYVGDNYYDDGVGSKKAGMDFVIVNSFGTLGVEELRDCPIIPDITCLEEYI